MRCPTLAELPAPPSGKTGWPWAESSKLYSDKLIAGPPWPKVSIVTPSFNQAQFLEETIRSVLLQGYPNLEYIIIDGGSTDGSREIIKKYEPWLAYWVSEPDQGQSHAINKGFAWATGEIYAWLNSDDTYQPNAIGAAVSYLSRHPTVGMVYGHANVIDSNGHLISHWTAPTFDLKAQLFQYRYIPQQSAFFRRLAFEQVGGVEQKLYYTMDYDLWLRMGKRYCIDTLPQTLANYREHQTSKTVTNRYANRTDILRSLQRFFADPDLPPALKKLEELAYGMLYLHQSLGAFQENDRRNGSLFLHKAFSVAPQLAHRCRERVLKLLVAYASSEPYQAEAFFDVVRNKVPPSAQKIHQLLKVAQNRIIILAAIRSQNFIERNQAKSRIGAVLRYDLAWLAHRQVFLSVVSLLMGPQRFKRLVEGRRRLTVKRSSLSVEKY